jgi:hypothetical protein
MDSRAVVDVLSLRVLVAALIGWLDRQQPTLGVQGGVPVAFVAASDSAGSSTITIARRD